MINQNNQYNQRNPESDKIRIAEGDLLEIILKRHSRLDIAV